VIRASWRVLPGLQKSIWVMTSLFSPSTSWLARLPVCVPLLLARTTPSVPTVPVGFALLKIEICAASSMLLKSTVKVLGVVPGGTVTMVSK